MTRDTKPRAGHPGKQSPATVHRRKVAMTRRQLRQAEIIGWWALADSFRRDLAALGVAE